MDINHYLHIPISSTNWLRFDEKFKLDEYLTNIRETSNEKILEKFQDDIFHCFQIDLNNWAESEFILTYKCRLTINDVDNMEYYRIQNYIKNFQKYQDEKRKQEEKNEASQNGKQSLFNQGDMMNNVKKMSSGIGMPKIPKF